MWLVISLIATVVSIILYYFLKEKRAKYKLGLLTMMLLGTFLMVLTDKVIAFKEGEPFIETTTDGLIHNSILLGVLMLLPIIATWFLIVAFSWQQRSHKSGRNSAV